MSNAGSESCRPVAGFGRGNYYIMKFMRRPHRHNLLFRAACEGLKLLALMLAGFISACLFLAPFGAFEQAEAIIQVALPFFFRLTVSLLSLIAISGLFEALEDR